MDSIPSHSKAAKPLAERLKRREMVESLLRSSVGPTAIERIVCEQFPGTSDRTVRSDVRHFRRLWTKIDQTIAGRKDMVARLRRTTEEAVKRSLARAKEEERGHLHMLNALRGLTLLATMCGAGERHSDADGDLPVGEELAPKRSIADLARMLEEQRVAEEMKTAEVVSIKDGGSNGSTNGNGKH